MSVVPRIDAGAQEAFVILNARRPAIWCQLISLGVARLGVVASLVLIEASFPQSAVLASSTPSASPVVQIHPVIGDWDGDGDDTVGYYDPATSFFHLRNSNTPGNPDLSFQYGSANCGWVPLVGDWNGDGKDTIGLFDPSTAIFHLRNTNDSGVADLYVQFGSPGHARVPLVGDWNGDGIDTVGLYQRSRNLFILRNSNTSGPPNLSVGFGVAGPQWFPHAGHWNPNGNLLNTVGMYNPSTARFHLRLTISSSEANDAVFQYGSVVNSRLPLVGDFDGNGTDTVALYDPADSTFYLRNLNTQGAADLTFPFGPAQVTSPPPALGAHPFYGKHTDAAGIPVLAHSVVHSTALLEARRLAIIMLSHRPDLKQQMMANPGGPIRIAIIGRYQVTTDIPEYSWLPPDPWNQYRGLGATPETPVSSAAEENLLGLLGDVYQGESIFIHEFAHSIHVLGIRTLQPSLDAQLEQAYAQAIVAGRWINTYAATNVLEYFAEGTQVWFQANRVGPPGGDGIHNDIATRGQLIAYDPPLAAVLQQVYGSSYWRFDHLPSVALSRPASAPPKRCPAKRAQRCQRLVVNRGPRQADSPDGTVAAP